MRLTAAGEKFRGHAESLLARHDEILADMGGTALKGSVSLGCPEDYSIAFLPDLLRGFCALHADVELRMVCAPTTELRLIEGVLYYAAPLLEPGVDGDPSFGR